MALESLSNALQSLGAQPYVMNLRSQTALTNNVTWSATTQYFINDMVRSPLNGGMYVLEAWDGAANTASCLLSANDPASLAGKADGWASTQGDGLKTVQQVTATLTGGAPAAAVGNAAALSLTLLNAIGKVSTWLVKLDYVATNAAFAAPEWVLWTVTPNGTGGAGLVEQCNHVFGQGATTSGSPVSVVVTLPADGTQLNVAGTQSAVNGAGLAFAAPATATFVRLA